MHLRIDAINPFSYCSHIAAIRESLFSSTASPLPDHHRPRFKGKRWTGLNGPEGWQLSQGAQRKAPNQFSSGQGRGWREGNTEIFTDAPGYPGALGKQPEHQSLSDF